MSRGSTTRYIDLRRGNGKVVNCWNLTHSTFHTEMSVSHTYSMHNITVESVLHMSGKKIESQTKYSDCE